MRPIKFIVFGGNIYFGNVAFHKDLIPKNAPRFNKVAGGGIIEIFRDDKVVGLAGQSYDFGPADKQAIKTILSQQDKLIDFLFNLEMVVESRDNEPIELKGYKIIIYGDEIN